LKVTRSTIGQQSSTPHRTRIPISDGDSSRSGPLPGRAEPYRGRGATGAPVEVPDPDGAQDAPLGAELGEPCGDGFLAVRAYA
jgi:hypothetical protein